MLRNKLDAPARNRRAVDRYNSGNCHAGRTTIAGVAWAPDRGVDAAEVAIDDGAWMPATLSKPLSDATIKDAAAKAMAICDPADDLRGDREYKTAMAGQMVKRALRRAAALCG